MKNQLKQNCNDFKIQLARKIISHFELLYRKMSSLVAPDKCTLL